MAVRTAGADPELIDAVCERLRERVSEERAPECERFVRQYYRWVPLEDLSDRFPVDLYGAAMAHLNLARQRKQGKANVRVYNPEFDQDGWASPHTVIEHVTDDMPFLVDSVTMELARQGYSIALVAHPVVWVRRDGDGELLEVLEHEAQQPGAIAESMMHVEITREPDRQKRTELRDQLEHRLDEVRVAVEDWAAMREQTDEVIAELERNPPPIEEDHLKEVKAFLRWVMDDNFTYLGYREYGLTFEGDDAGLKADPDSGRGILRGQPASPHTKLSDKALKLAREPYPLVLTKANSRATVHRPSYLDYVGVKRYDEDGQVIGERRFLGLYTSAAYGSSLREIPLLRGKVQSVMKRAGFPEASHDAKALREILESHPRDSLLQVTTDELFDTAMGILSIGERPRVRLFVRPDPLDRYFECLVTIPRDRYNSESRTRVGNILMEAFNGTRLDWSPHLSESVLARVYYIVRCGEGPPADYDLEEIESRVATAARAWSDDLRDALLEEHGEEQGTALHRRYEEGFPPAYRADWEARAAVEDIRRIEELESPECPTLSLYRPVGADEDVIRCKLYSSEEVALSSVLPTFEHMGAKVTDERPYKVKPSGRDSAWIYDFGLDCRTEDLEQVREIFQEAFLQVWRGELEDDGLNGLVLRAAIPGRDITILRAIAKYLRQARIPYSDAYMERTLTGHPDITRLLVKMFYARFDPDQPDQDLAERLARAMEMAVDGVPSLDEDKILRGFLAVVRAVLRTNFFCCDEDDVPPECLSFKLDPSELSLLPLPRPRYEIFVYSPRYEGVHLRGGRVARGGLRWSDRPEDFRTEVLGLMKAQMVKNALIVPVGSKGGFVLKRPPPDGDRGALQEEAIACYQSFLGGMLDVTDNIVDKKVVAPDRVVRYDDDDPYLVVAADKGTATFSDIANEVSASYNFWLGDAFASGGSHGYDHKEMGITARGAWESVKRHFRELGTDIQSEDFTVVGIGDMSGDVFGNGTLLSPHIRLVAAFNHAHVFLDPDPDPKASFQERKRLFKLDRSSWSDYDESKLSDGGGVFERTAKSIKLSDPVKQAFDIDADELAPSELIKELLRAKVDLLWNGGIGTYVKAASENNADVGDKANDAVRVDGRELRCRVVGEGGNLGFTQQGRIEFARAGGPGGEGARINTDAIDNVAGVNCSDHEVNIKILLDSLVADEEITEDERNDLLVEMTDAVAESVLYGSYTQTQAMSLGLAQAAPMVDVHARLIRRLEQVAALKREIEFLPDEDELAERKSASQGIVAPELAVVMAYAKIHLYTELLESDLPEDPYLAADLERYFPAPLPERYSEKMREHRLRREIISTVVANQLVDRAGTTFAFRLREETSAPPSILARGFAVAREVFDMRSFWSAVEQLDNEVDANVQVGMLIDGRRLVERATRWLVRANPGGMDIAETIECFEPGAQMLVGALPEVLDGADHEAFSGRAAELEEAGVPAELAARVAGMPSMLPVFDIVEVAGGVERDPEEVMSDYFRLGSRLELNWLRDRILELPRANRWQALARAALRDDLATLHRALTQAVLHAADSGSDPDGAIDTWSEHHGPALERTLGMISDVKASRTYDTTTLPVVLREVRNLLRGSQRRD